VQRRKRPACRSNGLGKEDASGLPVGR